MPSQITLAGGCFWCTESVFIRVPGVLKSVSGYANGTKDRPSYDQVCTGKTGHAEVVQIDFDPSVIGLPALLDLFFQAHDPTQLNAQGNDIGTQYRSSIYHTDAAQKAEVAEAIHHAPQEGRTARRPRQKTPVRGEFDPPRTGAARAALQDRRADDERLVEAATGRPRGRAVGHEPDAGGSDRRSVVHGDGSGRLVRLWGTTLAAATDNPGPSQPPPGGGRTSGRTGPAS